jgi:flagellar motor switch protein FliG
LTVALKGTSEQLRNHMLSCMSQRGADMLREDMDALGPVKIKEVESGQQQIIALVRQLESEGVLSLKGAVGEQYVV